MVPQNALPTQIGKASFSVSPGPNSSLFPPSSPHRLMQGQVAAPGRSMPHIGKPLAAGILPFPFYNQYNTSSTFLSLKSTHIHKGKGATCYLQIIRNPGLLIQMALIEENAQYKGSLTKKNRFYLVLDLPSMYHMQTGNIGNVGGQSGLDKIAPKNEIVFWGLPLNSTTVVPSVKL